MEISNYFLLRSWPEHKAIVIKKLDELKEQGIILRYFIGLDEITRKSKMTHTHYAVEFLHAHHWKAAKDYFEPTTMDYATAYDAYHKAVQYAQKRHQKEESKTMEEFWKWCTHQPYDIPKVDIILNWPNIARSNQTIAMVREIMIPPPNNPVTFSYLAPAISARASLQLPWLNTWGGATLRPLLTTNTDGCAHTMILNS